MPACPTGRARCATLIPPDSKSPGGVPSWACTPRSARRPARGAAQSGVDPGQGGRDLLRGDADAAVSVGAALPGGGGAVAGAARSTPSNFRVNSTTASSPSVRTRRRTSATASCTSTPGSAGRGRESSKGGSAPRRSSNRRDIRTWALARRGSSGLAGPRVPAAGVGRPSDPTVWADGVGRRCGPAAAGGVGYEAALAAMVGLTCIRSHSLRRSLRGRSPRW